MSFGHRKIQNVLVSSTLDWEKLHSAYVKGAKKLKFDIQRHTSGEFENSLSDEQWKIFTDVGMTRDLLDPEEIHYTGSKIVLNKLSYTRLWLFTAQIGNKQL